MYQILCQATVSRADHARETIERQPNLESGEAGASSVRSLLCDNDVLVDGEGRAGNRLLATVVVQINPCWRMQLLLVLHGPTISTLPFPSIIEQ